MISTDDFSSLEDQLRWGAHDASRQTRLLAELAGRPDLARDADQDGGTLLMVAANAGNLDAVRLLCGQGADPRAVSLSGENALIAVVQGARDGEPGDWRALAETLMAHGADPNQIALQGCSALHWAVIHAMPELVQALLDGGGDPAVRLCDPPDSDSAIELAASNRFRGTPQQRADIASMLARKVAP